MNMKFVNKIIFTILFTIMICLSTEVFAKNISAEGDIVSKGDVFGNQSGAELIFFKDSTIIASIATSGRTITFGTVPDNYIWNAYVIEYPGDPNYTGNYSNTPSKFFDYIDSVSEYWKVVSVHSQTYGGWPAYNLVPLDYKGPVFEIECTPTLLYPEEEFNCSLNVIYYLKLDNLSFTLDTGKFDIKDEKTGSFFKNLNIDNGIYSLSSVDSLNDNPDGSKITILNFTIVPKNGVNVIDDENNIKALSISYEDVLSTHTYDQVSTTVKLIPLGENKTNNIKNPNTNNEIYLILLFVGVCLVSTLLVLKHRKLKGQ